MPSKNDATSPPSSKGIQPGDEVQWNWGGGHPSGIVAEVNAEEGGEIEIKTAKGNKVNRKSDPENPAVRIGTQKGKSDVVKRASELKKVGDVEDED
jgi:hypothetical protein